MSEIFSKHNWTYIRPWTRHSLVLFVAGVIYIGIGAGLRQVEPHSFRAQALVVAISWMSLKAWAWVFYGAGLLCVVSSRWPRHGTIWGYMVLTGLSSAWSAFYFTGVFLKGTNTANLTGGFTWGVLAFMWWAISGLVNPGDQATVYDPR